MTQEQLDTLVHNLNTQDNRITADPLFLVEQKNRVYGVDPDYNTQGYIWVNEDDSSESYDTDEDLKAHLLSKGKPVEEIDWTFDDTIEIGETTYKKLHYHEYYEFVCAHFTEAAADRYIKLNRHNLNEPRTYVSSQYRCHEWNAVVEALKSGQLVLREG